MRRHIPVFALVLVAALAIAEIALRMLAPVSLATVGHMDAANARYYGWGYDPGDRIRLRDPDTHATFADVANNRGWRDRDRAFDNPHDALRIVALGDSNTFGMIVPAEETWTRQLERMLEADGIAAEVINLSYPGWSTRQQREAIRREGVRYGPDIVVLQFTINDLADNLADAPSFAAGSLAKRAAARLELTKRLYLAATALRFANRARYSAIEAQIAQLRTVLGLGETDCLVEKLAAAPADGFDDAELDAWLDACAFRGERDVVRRILESQPFKEHWTPLQYDPPAADPASEQWQAFVAFFESIADATRAAGAALVVLSDQEEGIYEWERYWYRVAPGDAARTRYLSPNAVLRATAARAGASFVEPREKVQRARNDSHPNVEGSAAMARNVLAHLEAEHSALLSAHRAGGAR